MRSRRHPDDEAQVTHVCALRPSHVGALHSGDSSGRSIHGVICSPRTGSTRRLKRKTEAATPPDHVHRTTARANLQSGDVHHRIARGGIRVGHNALDTRWIREGARVSVDFIPRPMPEHGNNSNTRSRRHRYSVGVLQLGDAERGRTRQRWPTRQRHGGKREGEGESGLACPEVLGRDR